jgi:pimeloyl-ACP methyl ester carboxylesterase
MTMSHRRRVGCALLLFVCWSAASGQKEPAKYAPPKDIAFRKATVISEGTRLAAELFALKDNDGKALPTIILCHGWGGVAEMLRPDAVAFARAGYLVVTFDYRGWGASDGKVVLTKPAARGKPGVPLTSDVM